MNKNIKKIIKNYQFDNKNILVDVCQKELNNYCKYLFLQMIKSNYYNSESFIINVINHFNNILQIDLGYNINKSTSHDIKDFSLFVTIPKSKKYNDRIKLLQKLNYNDILRYILYLNKEIRDINYHKGLYYPYLNSYSVITKYTLLLHYSNLR